MEHVSPVLAPAPARSRIPAQHARGGGPPAPDADAAAQAAARRELARAEESAAAARAEIATAAARLPDASVRLVKKSFAALEPASADVMKYFYARLFVRHPGLRAMFPLAMSAHRQRFFDALGRVLWSTGSPAEFASQVSGLAGRHRKFGVKPAHFEPFFSALLATVREFSGDTWTGPTEQAWEEVLACISDGLKTASGATDSPPWWLGEIVRHDRRGPDLAVLTIRPAQPLPYRPGQYLSVQVARWPRIWRRYSIANAPRADGLLDLHVRAVPGGMVSNALVQHAQAGDSLLLGPAEGTMTIPGPRPGEDPGHTRDLLCVAGGTGLAPVKALIEGVIADAGAAQDRRITLFAGARQAAGLYDLACLSRLAAACPGLTVVPVVSQDPDWTGLSGLLPDVIRQQADVTDREVFVSGPGPMVAAVLRILAGRLPPSRVHYDPAVLAAL